MATKSALNTMFWWIPTCELESDRPTAFRMRQMSKKDFDAYRHKNQLGAMLPLLMDAIGKTELEEEVRDIFTRKQAEEGFDTALYRNCVLEIVNMYVDEEFRDSITEPEDIVTAIAGIGDLDVSDEMDEVLWRRSTLEDFETVNFTPSSGCKRVCRTTPEDPKKEPSIAANAEKGRIGLRPGTTAVEEDIVSNSPSDPNAPN